MTSQTDDHAQAYRPSGPLDPIADQLAQAFSAMPFSANPIEATRAALKAATVVSGEPRMEAVDDHHVPVAGGTIGLRLYRPVARPAGIMIWVHGGGFALGSVEESDNFARLLAKETGWAVASVDYRLAPEHKFPTAVEDVHAAALWVAARKAELAGGDVPLVMSGDSAGGTLATVVTRRLHEAGTARIAGQVLLYPGTDSPDTDTLDQFAPPFLTAQDVRWFNSLYLPSADVHRHPDAAPLHAGNLALLPPTLIVTAEHDIITAQAEQYGRKLQANGVATQITRYPGMIHGFATMDPFFPGAAGRVVAQIASFVAALPR